MARRKPGQLTGSGKTTLGLALFESPPETVFSQCIKMPCDRAAELGTGELKARELRAGGLRLVLVRRGDRFGHRIFVETEAGSDVDGLHEPGLLVDSGWLVESVEGSAQEVWPASPPLVDAHCEGAPARARLLLVGMAGKSHWSACMSVVEGHAAIDVDVACRVREAPLFLGTTYKSSGRVTEHPRGLILGDRVLIVASGGQDCVTRVAADDCGLVRIAPRDLSAERLPLTARWKYQLQLL